MYNNLLDIAAAGLIISFILIYIAICILILVARWKIFSKAGKPGWAAIIPVYCIYTMSIIVDSFGSPLCIQLWSLLNLKCYHIQNIIEQMRS